MDIVGIEQGFVYDPDLVAEVCDETRFLKQIEKTPLHHVRDVAGAGLLTAHQHEEKWARRILLPAWPCIVESVCGYLPPDRKRACPPS